MENVNAKNMDEKLDPFFNNFKCASKVNVAFGFVLKRIDKILRSRKQYAAGSIQICVHQGWYGKIKKIFSTKMTS